ncbi:cytochrome c3 family protein [Lentisphaera marina]
MIKPYENSECLVCHNPHKNLQ